MAIIDTDSSQVEGLPQNYLKYVLSDRELVTATRGIIQSDIEPFVFDGVQSGDEVVTGFDPDSAIYLIDGRDSKSDIARTLEARVEAMDANWLQDPLMTARYHEPIEDGCDFLIFVTGISSDMPKPVGSMRIMRLLNGVKGAAEYNFELGKPGEDVPELLMPVSPDEKVLDIADIVVLPDYRLSKLKVSSWLNYSLNKFSREEGIDRWVTCMNDIEAKVLNHQGVFFDQVSGDEVEYDGDGTKYRFYSARPNEVREQALSYARSMLNETGVRRAMGSRALIGATGVALNTNNGIVVS